MLFKFRVWVAWRGLLTFILLWLATCRVVEARDPLLGVLVLLIGVSHFLEARRLWCDPETTISLVALGFRVRNRRLAERSPFSRMRELNPWG